VSVPLRAGANKRSSTACENFATKRAFSATKRDVKDNSPSAFGLQLAAVISQLLKRVPLFWVLQLCGWSAFSVAFLLNTLPYLNDRLMIAYRVVFTTTAFLSSLILWKVCGALWRRQMPWLRAFPIVGSCCYALGHFCVALGLSFAAWADGSSPDRYTWLAPVPSALNGVFLMLAWCGAYFGVKYHQRVLAEQRRAEEAESRARHAQLLALQYQVRPHFPFNTLNAISTLVVEGDRTGATHMITRLADFFRATLEGPPGYEVSLADDLELTQQYLEIEKVRLGFRLRVRIDASDEVMSCAVPHLLLQPIVENAVHHGVIPQVAGDTISISASQIDGCLRLTVSNDGNGNGLKNLELGLD
jgi:hypothetical protein